MTGLNLETFLQLLRVAPGAWASLGVATVILALMTWTSWGSRRVLRKCLFLSIGAHFLLIFYGGASPGVQRFFRLGVKPSRPEPAIDRIKVISIPDSEQDPATLGKSRSQTTSAWDRESGALALATTSRPLPRPDRVESPSTPQPVSLRTVVPLSVPTSAPELGATEASVTEATARPADPVHSPEPLAEVIAPGEGIIPPAPTDSLAPETAPTPPTPVATSDLRVQSRPRSSSSSNLDRTIAPPTSGGNSPTLLPTTPVPPPERDLIAPIAPAPIVVPATDSGRLLAAVPVESAVPIPIPDEVAASTTPDPTPLAPAASAPNLLSGADLRRPVRSGRPAAGSNASPLPAPLRTIDPMRSGANLGSLVQVTPAIASAVPTLPRATGRRSLAEVPSVYRSRLDPNRSALAQRAGASQASERAVEQALEWLAKHQDADGRWDGGTVKFKDGHVADTDDTYVVHCPPGDICYGECYYGEADTALTGLSLLAYLGAGYTQIDGKYADTVARGIGFLRQSQKPDGDLRGSSLAVGMYCHTMATLALCEAYALTGDPTLQRPVERGIEFLIQARALDGMAWRYAPGAPAGDTSILGWAVMALKSAKTVGIPIPPPIQSGIATWLNRVADGKHGGLARYQPLAGVKVTPTMTAEAWACRQFLELGGPGPASDEAAASLLANPSDRGEFNVYYLYYGTLAMYQHGGVAWSTWNARVRDQVVAHQQTQGHKAGSWDPDTSPYGTHGGRIYCTALATLTLEVYYRFLRLYSPTNEPANPLAPRPNDNGARRAGFHPPRPPLGSR